MNRKYIGLISGIILLIITYLLPEPDGLSPQAKNAAGVALLMAIWWISEALPIYVTAFTPMVLFPFLNILPAGETAVNYGHDLVLMLLAGFFLAKSIEAHNLHKRIALFLINLLGTSKRKILLSMMIATAFLSMWIANVTAAVIMLPIALAIITKEESETGTAGKFGIALMLAIAYSASIGGTATLIGSPTNLIFSGIVTKIFPTAPQITFFEWLKVGLPLVIFFLPLVWLYLSVYFKLQGNILGNTNIIAIELKQMGKMNSAEKRVASIFAITAFAWIFREEIVISNSIIPGWSNLLGMDQYVKDSTVGMLAALLLFAIPAGNNKRLLDWKSASQIPWGVGVIVGGGYAMAESFKVTGLAEWLGSQLVFVNDYHPLIVVGIVVAFILLFTELNPNTATVNIFLPILASLAVAGNINPLFLMIPATFASSFVFLMPAGTGPNTVIFGSNKLTVSDMVKCGAGLKLMSLIVLTFFMYFLVTIVLGFDKSMPNWAY